MNDWDIARVQSYITSQVEENLNLDYKAAGSLQRQDDKRQEITKDVSAMANADGGILIYGIKEYTDKARKHLPEGIDPIDRTVFSKETLEHVVNSIRPKIDGLTIHPVPIPDDPSKVIYVVDIPQSHTAHQAKDHKYYKRFNFESVPMEDYEIRDVMFRVKSPQLDIKFDGRRGPYDQGNRLTGDLLFSLENKSLASAKNVVIAAYLGSPPSPNHIDISADMLPKTSLYRDPIHSRGNIRTRQIEIVHKGLTTTAVVLEYSLYTIPTARMTQHDIEFGLFADDMEAVHIKFRISLSQENAVSVDRL